MVPRPTPSALAISATVTSWALYRARASLVCSGESLAGRPPRRPRARAAARPTDACRGAVVYDSDGMPTDRSMVYTEYFVRGTEPIDYCQLHSRPFDAAATS